MEEIKVEDKVCKVITKADEITIDQLMRCDVIMGDNLKTELDKYVEIIQILSNLTVEEIEDLPITTLKEVISVISTQDFNLNGLEFKNEIVLDGITFKNRNTDADNIKFTVKEIFTIKEYFKENKSISLPSLIGIIFRELDVEGNISRDLSDEAIHNRSEKLKHITLDVILPFINEMKNQI